MRKIIDHNKSRFLPASVLNYQNQSPFATKSPLSALGATTKIIHELDNESIQSLRCLLGHKVAYVSGIPLVGNDNSNNNDCPSELLPPLEIHGIDGNNSSPFLIEMTNEWFTSPALHDHHNPRFRSITTPKRHDDDDAVQRGEGVGEPRQEVFFKYTESSPVQSIEILRFHSRVAVKDEDGKWVAGNEDILYDCGINIRLKDVRGGITIMTENDDSILGSLIVSNKLAAPYHEECQVKGWLEKLDVRMTLS